MAQQLLLRLKGLYTFSNVFSAVPEGALLVADNIVIDQPSVAQTRRGQSDYGTTLASGIDGIERIMPFKDSLIVHSADSLLYDPDQLGTWVTYAGTYRAPETDLRIRDTRANRNLYLTTSGGVVKLDELAGEFRQAGAPAGLSATFATTGSNGFLSISGTVAYRHTLGYTDANDNNIVGPPSERTLVSNDSLTSKDVEITTLIPEGITTQWFYQYYRSGEAASLTADPGDELQLVKEAFFTSAEITAGEWTYTDSTPDALRGAALYTNPTQQTIAQANNAPPFARDLATYREMTLYANTQTFQSYTTTLQGVGEGAFGYLSISGSTTSGDGTMTLSGTTTENIHVGMKVVGSAVVSGTTVSGVPTTTTIILTPPPTGTSFLTTAELQDSITVAEQTYYAGSSENITFNQFEAVQDDTPSVNIAYTAQNLVRAINENPNNSDVYAYYLSGEDDLPGQMLFKARSLNEPVFYVISTIGDAWNPELPTSGTSQASTNDVAPNRVYASKVNQPEAVPLLNYVNVGSADFPILRIQALRENAVVWKEDGIWTITGFSPNDLAVSLLDSSAVLVAPETAVVLNNKAYGYTTQGVVAVSDAGPEIVSLPIQDALQEVSSDSFSNFSSMSFAVGYESDHQYHLFVPTETDDTYPTQDFVYNYVTNSWTRWPISRTCGVINPRDNRFYLGDPVQAKVRKERKSYNRSDYADLEIDTDIVSSDGTELVVTTTAGIEEAWTLVQSSRESQIVSISGSTLTVSDELSWEVGPAIAYEPILTELQWVQNPAGNPGIQKHFPEVTFLFKDASFEDIAAGFSSNFAPAFEFVTLETEDLGGAWGRFPWGTVPWGAAVRGTQPLRTFVPREFQRAIWLNLSLSLEEAFTSFSLEGVSVMFDNISPRWGRPQ